MNHESSFFDWKWWFESPKVVIRPCTNAGGARVPADPGVEGEARVPFLGGGRRPRNHWYQGRRRDPHASRFLSLRTREAANLFIYLKAANLYIFKTYNRWRPSFDTIHEFTRVLSWRDIIISNLWVVHLTHWLTDTVLYAQFLFLAGEHVC